ncbi:MAG: pyridoxamine 5'-phosphate oxidase family protein, partial [Miltoncostaeaceae bacterium]
MTDDEALGFLADGARTGKLAVADGDGAPYLAAVWFVVDDGDIVFMTGANTRKGRALRGDGRAALLADDERPPFSYARVE